MRHLTLAAFFGLLAALAGCGSPEPLAQPSLAEGASRFHDKGSNTIPPADKLPRKYTDSTDHEVDLLAYRGKANVVLVVVKGFPPEIGAFCPGCLAQVNALVAHYDEFKKRDAEVLVLFPGARDTLPQYLKEGQVDGVGGNPSVPFPVLLDPDFKAVDSLGIRAQLARQSTFIIDKRGDVVFGYVGVWADSYDRPSVKALLAQLDKLNATK